MRKVLDMETVVVLLATYNGERFLEEQLDSILQQEGVYVEIVIRDDASTDETVSIIRRYQENYSNITFLSGENVGSALNFWILAQYAKEKNADFYSFADQDDIWYKDKLKTAVNKIKHINNPALYFSEMNLIDAHGKMFGKGLNKKCFEVNKNCCLVQNQAAGCTMVFNRKALQIYTAYEPRAIQMHDFWMFILMSFFGSIVYDNEPHMEYRQHENNVVGANNGLINRWKARIKYIHRLTEHPRENMAKELLAGYGAEMTSEDVSIVSKVACYRESIRKRLALLFNRTIKMSDREKDFWYRIRILFGDI